MPTATIEPTAQEPCAECKPPQSAEQPDADPTTGSVKACEGLRRLATRFPKQVEKILRVGEPDSAGEGRCAIYDELMHSMNQQGYALIADVAEFIENWPPSTAHPPEQASAQPDAAQPKRSKWTPGWSGFNLRQIQEEIELLAGTVHTISELLYDRADAEKAPEGRGNETISQAGLLGSTSNRMRGLAVCRT